MRLAGQPGKLAAAPHAEFSADRVRLLLRGISQIPEAAEPEAAAHAVAELLRSELPSSWQVGIQVVPLLAGDSPVEPSQPGVGEPGGAISIPIRSGGRLVAILSVRTRHPDGFALQDVTWLEVICGFLGERFHRLQTEEEARRGSAKVELMSGICRQVLAAQSIAPALELAVRQVVDRCGWYSCGVALLSGDRSHLVYQTFYSQEPVGFPAERHHEIGQGLIGQVAVLGRTLRRDNLEREGGRPAWLPGADAELCIPLLAADRLLGVLQITAGEGNAFRDEDVRLLEMLAGVLAGAIEKAEFLLHNRHTLDCLENLIAEAHEGIFVLDRSGVVVRWNQGMERITGLSANSTRGRTIVEPGGGALFQRAHDLFERVMSGERPAGVEEKTGGPAGSELDVVLTMSPIISPSGARAGVSGIVRDVTERRRLEEGLSAMHARVLESETRFMDMIENAQDAILLVDEHDSRILQANRKSELITGTSRDLLIGRIFSDLHPEEERENARDQFRETLRTGVGPSVVRHILGSCGEAREVETTSSILNLGNRRVVQWFCRDISDRCRAEREKRALHLQLLQSEKLSALGHLVSGVAHEMNNPLTGVIGYSQLLAGLECDERVRRGLERIHTEATRCHRVVRNLLTFVRKHVPEKSYISINDILESTIEFCAYQMRVDEIDVRGELAKNLPRTMGDFHQLQQAFMNLVSRAHDSIHQTGCAGRLTIRSSCVGDIVRVEISDTGPGIPPEELKNLFDPSFTMKPRGQGSWFGLSICFGIIQEHQGRIAATSTPGEGTTFTIELPVLKPAGAHAHPDAPNDSLSPPAG